MNEAGPGKPAACKRKACNAGNNNEKLFHSRVGSVSLETTTA
jgi:hypothetical protein